MASSTRFPSISDARLMGKNPQFIRLFHEGRQADVVILCGATQTPILCHRFIFLLHSPVFETILSQRWAESPESESDNSSIATIKLPDDDPDILKVLIAFFYFDQELEDVPQALELIQMAHKYECPHVVTFCSKYVQTKLDLENVVNVYHVSYLLDQDELITASNKYISTNFTSLISTRPFLDMDRNHLVKFLEDKVRKIGIVELDIFYCIYNWTKAECQRNKKANRNDIVETIRPLLTYVNLPGIPFTDFTTKILPKNILTHEATIGACQYYLRISGSRPNVKLDVCDLINSNYSRRLLSTHRFKCKSSQYGGGSFGLSEIRFSYDRESCPKDSNIQILVGVKMDGVTRYYMNDLEDQLLVKFLPAGITPKSAESCIEIFWSEKYEFTDFPLFSPDYPNDELVVHSSNNYQWTFQSPNQSQPIKSECPLKFFCFM